MPYVQVPKDLSKIKTKLAFNLTKRQLICFSVAGALGIPVYLLTRGVVGNTPAMLLMVGLMLPCFFFAMFERDGLPFEKVLRNYLLARFLWPAVRPYQTENIYAVWSGPGTSGQVGPKPKPRKGGMTIESKRPRKGPRRKKR